MVTCSLVLIYEFSFQIHAFFRAVGLLFTKILLLLHNFSVFSCCSAGVVIHFSEVESLCQHWRLLEIIDGVVTRVMRDLIYKVV